MRTLLYVPILHPLCDMGPRGARYVLAVERSIGSNRTAAHLTALEELWRDIPNLVLEHLEASGIPWKRVHVFPDSLPRGTRFDPDAYVGKWLKQFSAVGSPMAAFIEHLRQLGAAVHGTEDEALVFAHSQLLNAPPSTEDSEERYRLHQRYTSLRDACVAMHVNHVVPDGHLALMFMGVMHGVDDLLESSGTFHVERIDLIDDNLLPLSHPLP